jgi:hypothetical protein
MCSTVLYHDYYVLLRGCSTKRLGNTLQRDLQNVQYSSRKLCQHQKMYKNASQDLEVYKIRTFMCNKKEQKHCLKKKTCIA